MNRPRRGFRHPHVLVVPARAHGGEVVYTGPVGPYHVIVTDRVLAAEQQLLYTLTVRDLATELPVDGADVSITARFADRTFGPRPAQYFGNQYQVLIPDEGAETIEVSLMIDGPAGTAAFQHEIAGSGGGGSGNSRLASLLLVLAGASAIAFDLYRRRRGRTSEESQRAEPSEAA